MNYFVIHSGKDLEKYVIPLINEWSGRFERLKFTILNGTSEEWEGDAVAKIRQANKVIIIIGADTSKSVNVDREIDFAIKADKVIYVYKLNDSYEINKKLATYDVNTETQKGTADGEMVLAHKKSKIIMADNKKMNKLLVSDNKSIWEHLISSDINNENKLMEQYKLFVQTSEDLVKRKQTVNSFYITLNSIILSAIITVLCATNDLPMLWGNVNFSFLLTLFTGLIGVVVCFSWISLLNSYADLNASKMDIIQCVEERMALNLYSTEWTILSSRLENRKYKSFSKKEKFVAYLFGVLYILTIVAGLIISFV